MRFGKCFLNCQANPALTVKELPPEPKIAFRKAGGHGEEEEEEEKAAAAPTEAAPTTTRTTEQPLKGLFGRKFFFVLACLSLHFFPDRAGRESTYPTRLAWPKVLILAAAAATKSRYL